MTTIRVFKPGDETGLDGCRAILGRQVFAGANAGDAVGAAINYFQEQGGDISAIRIHTQNFGGDAFFTDAQIARMKTLTARRDISELSEAEQDELQTLIFAELQASGKRIEAWNGSVK